VAAGTNILDPKFAGLLAEAVFSRAGQMPERDVVAALNTCTTMAAKAKLMAGKGLATDVDPLTEIRGWFSNRTSAPEKGPDEREPLPLEDELDQLDTTDALDAQKETADANQEDDGSLTHASELAEVESDPPVHGTLPEDPRQ
jgi:hypothetical protein